MERQSWQYKFSELRRVYAVPCRNVLTVVLFLCLYYIYILFMFVKRSRVEYSIRETLWISSAGFVVLTLPLSFRLIYLHLTHWIQPRVQKYVVRIIWMIPVYSIESWLALRYGSYTFFIETLRECYEAYVIYNFLYFLISLLGEEAHLVALLKEKPAQRGVHKWPTSMFVSSWIMGQDFLHKCKLGVFQYIILKNLMALITFLLASYHLYGDGTWRFDRGYMYIFVIDSVSQLWALYCMIMFYTATREELSPWKPVAKFLCVKMVVFATWWQAVALDVVLYGSENNNHNLSKAIQNFAICLEMFVASIAFSYAFSHQDFMLSNATGLHVKRKLEDPVATVTDNLKHPVLTALQSSLNLPDDIVSDIRRVTRGSVHYLFGKHATNEESVITSNQGISASTGVALTPPSSTKSLADLSGSDSSNQSTPSVQGLVLPNVSRELDIDIDLDIESMGLLNSIGNSSQTPLLGSSNTGYHPSMNAQVHPQNHNHNHSAGVVVSQYPVKSVTRPSGLKRLAQILSFGSFNSENMEDTVHLIGDKERSGEVIPTSVASAIQPQHDISAIEGKLSESVPPNSGSSDYAE